MQHRIQPYILLLFFLLPANMYAQENNMHISTTPTPEDYIKQIQYDTGVIMPLVRKGDVMKYRSFDSAKAIFSEIIRFSRNAGLPDGMAYGLLGLGSTYVLNGNYIESIPYFEQAKVYGQHSLFDRDRIMMLVYNNMAVPFIYQGDFETGIFYHYKALQQIAHNPALMMKFSSRFAMVYNNIGAVFGKNEQYDKALYYFRKAEQIALALNAKEYLSNIYVNIASVYSEQQNWVNHKKYLETGIKWSIRYHNDPALQAIYCEYGDSYVQRGMARTAIPYYEKALQITRNVNLYEGRLSTYMGLGFAYHQLKDYDKSEHYLLAMLQLAEQMGVKDRVVAKTYDTLAVLYNAKGMHEQAYKYQQAYIQLNNSLLNEEKNKAINKLEVQYRTAEKDKNITRQQLLLSRTANQLKDKNLLIGGISAIAFLLGAVLIGRYRVNKQRQQIKKLKAQMDGEEQERSRIGRELHDGIMIQFSAVKMRLSTLINRHKYIDGIEDFKDTMHMLDGATRELRRTAHNLMPDMLLEEGLEEAVFFFCKNLEKSTGLKINFQSYGSIPRLDPSLELSLYRTIQELVHNIIKHARATQAIVQLSGQEGLLMINVEDNGIGIPKDIMQSHNGIGIRNIQSRVHALNGKMDIQSTQGKGTSIYIEFNIGSTNKKIATA